MRKKKDAPHVAIFLPTLNGGGAERVAITLANGIAARGFSVDLVLASAQGPYLADVGRGVRIVDLKAGRVIKALWPLVRYWRRVQPVSMLSFMNHANVVAVVAHRLAGRPGKLILSERTNIFSAAKHNIGLQQRVVYALVPWTYPLADGITAVSLEAARHLESFAGLPAGWVKAIYNPFDLDRIQRLASEPLAHPWFASGQPPVVLAIGRLTKEKDFPTLIRAFSLVRQKLPARLLILKEGKGEMRASLEAMIPECGLPQNEVELPGFVRNPFAYLARCALFVLSSRWEGLPGVLIEAMACGAPVVATDCPSGPREILEDGRWGPLVPVGDVEALARAMISILTTPVENLPNVRLRARDFEQNRAIEAYLDMLGLPPYPGPGAPA